MSEQNLVKKFRWKAGAPQFPVSAAVAAETINNLQNSLGKDTITARELLDASRDVNAPLHSCFEWDDSVAAEQYRLSQSRQIIASVVVAYVRSDTPEQLKPSRYFINVANNARGVQGQFATVDVTFVNEDYRNTALRNAYRELCAFQTKYQNYQELSGVFDAIRDFGDTFK